MPLQRQTQSKPERTPHKVTPIAGEFGRYFVPSASAAKKGIDEGYTVDIFAEEHTESHGLMVGTCPCKGWSVRKTCTHLDDARLEHRRIGLELVDRAAEAMGFDKKD